MSPKIGITTQIIPHVKWYKYLAPLGLNTIEINRQNSKLHFNLYFLEKIRRYLQGYDLSLHSGTKGVFHGHSNFTKANLAVLVAEIDICVILGAKQLVFHLNNGTLPAENKEKLQGIIDYATDVDVRMMYESNSDMVASEAYDVLKSFPEIGYVLDLGHLNSASGGGTLGCDMDEFIRNVKGRVEYIHASNNCGTRDEHNALAAGTLDWRRILDVLDLSRVIKIIIEVNSLDLVEGTYADLVFYLKNRTKK